MINWDNMIEDYKEYLVKEYEKLEMRVVVYDEFELFRDYSDPLFNYPYEKRKNLLGSFKYKMI